MNNDFKDILLNRKSVKFYDENVKISHEEMLEMLDETVTAPSAVNLQPWRFVVAESKEAKDAILEISTNVNQVSSSAAVVVFFGDLQPQANLNKIYDEALATGKMPKEVYDRQVGFIKPFYDGFSEQWMREVVKIDTSLAAMQFMLVAREHGYDTNAMTGYEADKMAEKMGLDPKRYVPVMMISVGKAKEAGYDSVRMPAKDVTEFR